MNHRAASIERAEMRLAWLLVAPALAIILLVSLVPIAVTVWEALHVHDLRLPWLGRPFIGAGNFIEAAHDPRFRAALLHTVAFALISVPLELVLGLALALMMHSAVRGRALIRVSVAAALGDSDGRGGAAVAVHVRSPDRHPGGVVSDARRGRPCFRLVRAPAGGLGTDHCCRRVEDHPLRGNPASRRDPDDRPDTSVKRRGSTARARVRRFRHNHPAAPRAGARHCRRHFGCSMRCGCSI